jgi:hypothetical protein
MTSRGGRRGFSFSSAQQHFFFFFFFFFFCACLLKQFSVVFIQYLLLLLLPTVQKRKEGKRKEHTAEGGGYDVSIQLLAADATHTHTVDVCSKRLFMQFFPPSRFVRTEREKGFF